MPLSLKELRLFTAEILGAALLDLFPDIQLVGGAETPLGFHYDCIPTQLLDHSVISLMEEKMRTLIKEKIEVRSIEMMRENAIELLKHKKQEILSERLNHNPNNIVQLTQIGDFYDLAEIFNVLTTQLECAFKIQSIQKVLVHLPGLPEMEVTRISGTAFHDKKELKKFLKGLGGAVKRDHRILGKELRLFETRPEAPEGFWFWLPRGGVIRKTLLDWCQKQNQEQGFFPISTPRLLQNDKRSQVQSQDVELSLGREEYVMSTSLAPQHSMVYQSDQHSYRELPIRYMELAEVYRDECPSKLWGMLKAAQYVKDTAHIFCTPTQVLSELISSLHFINETIKIFGFEFQWILCNQGDRSTGSKKTREEAINLFVEALNACEFEYEVDANEVSRFGPRIELRLRDALGRHWRGPYIEFDFVHSKRFGLKYQGPDDKLHTPVMLRRSMFGSLERFVAILVEHFSGELPLWLAPEQVRVIPVMENHLQYAKEVQEKLEKLGLRAGIEYKGGKLAAKIQSAKAIKVPYLVIIGDREQEDEKLAVRAYDEPESQRMDFEQLSQQLLEEKNLKLLPRERKLD